MSGTFVIAFLSFIAGVVAEKNWQLYSKFIHPLFTKQH
jgi:hypothetical protein